MYPKFTVPNAFRRLLRKQIKTQGRGEVGKSKFRNSFRSLCAVSWCCLDTVVGPGPSGLGPPKARHVAWRKHCSAIGLPGSTVAVDKSAVGRWIRRAPMQPKSIGLRSLTSLDLIDLGSISNLEFEPRELKITSLRSWPARPKAKFTVYGPAGALRAPAGGVGGAPPPLTRSS